MQSGFLGSWVRRYLFDVGESHIYTSRKKIVIKKKKVFKLFSTRRVFSFAVFENLE